MPCFALRSLLAFFPSLGSKVITTSSGHIIDDTDYAGLLFARAYSVTSHQRLVLTILGTLGCCAILPVLVCALVNLL
jgi:hypothetical protein